MSNMFQASRDAAAIQRDLDQCAKDFDELRLRVEQIKADAEHNRQLEVLARVKLVIQEAIAVHDIRINSPLIVDRMREMGREHWLHEHGTLRLIAGRGTGHTHYIIQHAYRGDLVITRDSQFHALMMKVGSINTTPNQPTIVSLSCSLPMRAYNTVWIDGEHVYQKCLKRDLYSWLARMPVKKVVVLGS